MENAGYPQSWALGRTADCCSSSPTVAWAEAFPLFVVSPPLGPSCFPHVSVGKESACNAAGADSIPGSGGSPGVGSGNPLQYICLEYPMDRGAWKVASHGVTIGHDWARVHAYIYIYNMQLWYTKWKRLPIHFRSVISHIPCWIIIVSVPFCLFHRTTDSEVWNSALIPFIVLVLPGMVHNVQ